MTLDLTAVIDILGETDLITVSRRVAPTYVKGDPTPDPAPTVITMDALVSVATGKDLERLPEGDRTAEILVCYTKELVRGVNMTNETPADVIAYQGEEYEVIQDQDWDAQASVWKSLLRKVDPT